MTGLFMAHVVDERAAAALVLRQHDLDAEAGQHADCRFVDLRCEHGLRAAREQRDAALAGALRREGRGAFHGRARRRGFRRQRQHRAKLFAEYGQLFDDGLQWPCQHARENRQPEAVRVGQEVGEEPAHQLLVPGALVGRLDMRAGMVDQVHVVHARGAGRHAGEAGKAAVDVLHDLLRRGFAALEHLLDQVDAPARAVEFVAEFEIGRAGRGAEPAMHAGAQDLFRGLHGGIGQRREGEIRLHR